MSHALTIARKDVADAVRSLALWAVVGLFALLTAVVVGLPALLGDDAFTFREAIGAVVQVAGLIVPLVGLLIAYHSITAERESGSLRVLLSLPPSRRAIVAGKLLGRGAVVVLAGVVAVLLMSVVGGLLHGTLPVGSVLALGGSVTLLGLSFVGVAIGVSAAVSTRGRAMAVTVGFYTVAVLFWNLLLQAVQFAGVRLGVLTAGATPVWLRALSVLPPNKAFPRAFSGLQEGTLVGGSLVTSAALALVVMVAWVVLPPVLGYLRFRSADLG